MPRSGPVLAVAGGAMLAAAAAVWLLRPPEGTDVSPVPVTSAEAEHAPPSAVDLAGRGAVSTTARARRPRGPAPVPDGPVLRGRVVDVLGRPIAGARVLAIPDTAARTPLPDEVAADGGIGTENFTGDDGRFVVAATGDAPFHSLVAEAEGYAPASVGDVRAGSDTTIVLDAGVRIVGHVRTLDGDPVAGANLKACALLDVVRVEREATSGEDGGYRIDGLPRPSPTSGGYLAYACVQATKEGFAPLLVPGWAGGVAARAGEFTLDLVLIRGATLVGRVVDEETGAGLEDATVVLWSIESMTGSRRASGASLVNPWSPRVLAETRSGPDGTFRIEHVPARGFHRVDSHNSGRRGETLGGVGAWRTGYTWATDEVPVRSDGDAITAEVRLRPAGSFVGRVLGADGRPLAKANVQAALDDGIPRSAWVPAFLQGRVPATFATTDADGRYRLAAGPAAARAPARVRVTALEPRLDGTGMGPPAPRQASLVVDARAGEETVVPDLVLMERVAVGPAPPGVPVEVVVVVVDASDAPVWGARVSPAAFGRGGFFPSGRTDKDGRVRLRVPADPRGGPPPAGVVRAKGYAPAPLVWPPSPTAGEEVRVVLEAGHRLAGRVLDADGNPCPDAPVSVYDGAIALASLLPPSPGTGAPTRPWGLDPSRLPYATTMSGADGAFRVEDLPDGPCHVLAYGPSGRPATRGAVATAEGVAPDSTDLLLTLSSTPSAPTGRILVTVVDATTGRPVALADVTATRRRGRDEPPPGPTTFVSADGSTGYEFGPGTTDPVAARTAPGRFEVRDAPLGTYDLGVRAKGYVGARVEGVAVVAGDVEVPEVRLSRGIRVHGVVRVPGGVALRDRTVSFMPERAPAALAAPTADVGPDGRYEVSGLIPGAYTVRSFPVSPGYGAASEVYLLREGEAPVVLAEGEADVEVDLVLVAAGLMSVRVFDDRLPTSLGRGAAGSEARTAFGRGSTLVVTTKEGREVARADSLEGGVPPGMGLLVLPPGAYVVTYTPQGGPPKTQSADVAIGRWAEVEFGTRVPGR